MKSSKLQVYRLFVVLLTSSACWHRLVPVGKRFFFTAQR